MDRHLEAIRSLASPEMFDRYVVHGTASEYLVPDELVEDGLQFVLRVESGKLGPSLSPAQRDCLADLKVALEAANLDLPNDRIASDQTWVALREAARRFLDVYNGP